MQALIEAHGIVKRYDGFTAVDRVSFSVKQGEIFALLGPMALLMRMSATIIPWWDFGVAVAALALGAAFSL